MRPWPREGWEIHGGTKGTSESRVHKKTSPRRDGQSTQMHRDVGETRVQEDVCYWNFNSVNRERIDRTEVSWYGVTEFYCIFWTYYERDASTEKGRWKFEWKTINLCVEV